MPISNKDILVTDDFGSAMPIGSRELEVIEIYLGGLLDTMLRDVG